MASKKKSAKKGNVRARVTKTARSVGGKVAKTGKNVGSAIGHGASTAKTKTVAAFGAIKQKIRGKDEEE